MKSRSLNVEPNFYLSESYLYAVQAKCYEYQEWMWLEADEWILFPPVSTSSPIHFPLPNRIWSDFYGWKDNTLTPEFLDWEYLFDPLHFNHMEGGRWETYRKNIRKWPRANPDWTYGSKSVPVDDLANLFADWLEKKMGVAEDAPLLADYLLGEIPGVYHKGLFKNGILMAVNAWDENWKYINFRICIIRPEEPYLDEFARFQFYTDPYIQQLNKIVNDGGTVNSLGLERFKDKMNPIRKRKVYSWIKSIK